MIDHILLLQHQMDKGVTKNGREERSNSHSEHDLFCEWPSLAKLNVARKDAVYFAKKEGAVKDGGVEYVIRGHAISYFLSLSPKLQR